MTALDELGVPGVLEHRGQGGVRVAEVGDRLEQRHDVDGARHASCVDVDGDESDLLEEDGHLEHVADRLGHRDDVVRDRPFAESMVRLSSLTKYGEFAVGAVGVGGVGRDKRAWVPEFVGECGDARWLVQTEIVPLDARNPEQFGDDDLVDG